MIIAMLRVMFLGLIRDRSLLAMAFVLPPLIYLIFAAIFSGTTGDALRLRVAIFDAVQSPASARLVAAVRREETFRPPPSEPGSIAQLEAMLRGGEIDVGIVVRRDPAGDPSDGVAPVRVIGDEARAMAGPIVAGQVERLFGERLPDVAYRRSVREIEQGLVPFTPDQRARIDATLNQIEASLARDGAADRSGTTATTPREAAPAAARLVELVNLPANSPAGATVTYYAGAVGILFVLFSAFQGAAALIEERQTGLVDRLLSGGGTASTIVVGKFVYLTFQGVVQLALIFAVAYAAYDVNFVDRLAEWAMISLATSAAAAGIALSLAVWCSTRQQLQTLSNFLVLVLSALGGSMVPRFLMPPWLQDVSWFMPNAWAIEAYQALLWRNEPAADLMWLVGLLAAVATVALVVACATLGAQRQR